MNTTSLGRVSEWASALAAMLYLATFIATAYAIHAFARGASFLEAFAVSYPLAFAACATLFTTCVALEAATSKRMRVAADRVAADRVALQSLVHR